MKHDDRHRGVAQHGRAAALGAAGRRFESFHPDSRIVAALRRYYPRDGRAVCLAIITCLAISTLRLITDGPAPLWLLASAVICAGHVLVAGFLNLPRTLCVEPQLLERVLDTLRCSRGCSDADGFNPENCDCGAVDLTKEINALLGRSS